MTSRKKKTRAPDTPAATASSGVRDGASSKVAPSSAKGASSGPNAAGPKTSAAKASEGAKVAPSEAAGAKNAKDAKRPKRSKPPKGSEEAKSPKKAATSGQPIVTAEGERWIVVADVARPHGVRGELRLRVFSGDPTLLSRRPPIRLRDGEGRVRDARIASVRSADRALLVYLDGVEDRDQAEVLRGAEVLVARSEFEPLEEGEFYACDVEGARAELLTGEVVGTVTGLGTYPTCDVLLVLVGDKKLEVPILPHFVESVDVEAKVVKIVTLEGLT
ncbi:MAG: ribosome maturation factor RimM [Polyangiaceae bacterium]